jgi:predicted nucleic acid-binding Zn ribbon protein
MGLTNCPECGSQVSKDAVACPKCGHPFKKTVQGTSGCGMFMLIVLAIICAVVLLSMGC